MTTAQAVSLFLLLVVHGAVVYRVGRFIALDSLIDEPRDWVLAQLGSRAYDPATGRWGRLWRRKLMTLIECPWCVTVWVAGATTLVHHFFVDPLPYPVFWWLAINTVGLVFWDRIEPD